MSAAARIIPFPAERRRPRELVDLQGLIAAFGYSERWWRYRIREEMPSHKWGARLRFDLAEVHDWLEARYGAA